MGAASLTRVARNAAIGLAAVLGLAVLAHTLLWWQGCLLLAREAAGWIAAREAEGIVLRHGPPMRGGWPWAARLTLPGVSASGTIAVEGQGSVPVALSARAVVLGLELAAPRTLVISVETPFRLAAPPALDAEGEAALLRLRVPLAGEGGAAPDLLARGLVITTPRDRLGAEQLTLRLAREPAAGRGQPGLVLDLLATGVELPQSPQPVLGRRLARAALDLRVLGLPSGHGSARAQAAAWREAGGVVQVPRLVLDWGPLALDAEATLALDLGLQPGGEGRARMAGLPATLDRLAAAGLIDRQAAQAGRTLVAFMQRAPAGGGPPVVELPLALRNRTLSAGRMPLLQLPPIAWPP